MRIAFIRAYDPGSLYQWSMPPLGIGYLIAVLRRRFPAFDIQFHMEMDDLIAARPDLVGISSATENFTDARRMAARIREELGAPVVLGGVHVTTLPHTLPDCFDVGVMGEAENTLVDVVAAFRDGRFEPADLRPIQGVCYRDNGRVVVQPGRRDVEDLDTLPRPARDALGDRWAAPASRQVHLISSRGCPYDCSFCSSGREWTCFRQFSPEYVADEIEFLRETYDPEELFFFDDLFVASRAHFKRVCALFRERGLHEGVVFRTYARVNLIDDEILDLFESLNFRYIDFGFESNCERTLRYFNKTGVTPETNERAMELMRGRRVSVGANLIVGAPDETLDEMKQTYDFVARHRDRLDRVSMGPLFPMPGTRVWREALERGLVTEDEEDWSRLSITTEHWDYERYPLLSRTMTARELYDFYRHFLALCREINAQGARRKVEMDAGLREERYRRLRGELEAMKGSRIVRAALGLRRRLRDDA